MKKFKNIALLGATALVGVVGFSACSSDDDPTSNINEATGETVKTTFTLSIPNKVQTRMTTGAAQEDNKFSGMSGIYLFPFAKTGAVAGTDILSLSSIHLADFTTFNADGTSGSLNAKIYKDVSIPIGVNHFLFYGKKANGQGGELAASYETKTIGNSDAVSADIYFDLVSYNKDLTFAGIDVTAEPVKTILAALNGIAKELDDAAKDTNDGTTFTRYSTNWKKLKVGATLTIAKAVEDLYTSMKGIADSTTSTSNAQTLAKAVCAVIETYFTTTASGAEYTVAWKNGKVYPTAAMNLPDGAVGVNYDGATNTFSYSAVAINGMTQPELNTYVKPAQLFYFANTAIGVSNSIQSANYNNQADWNAVYTNLYDGAEGSVATTTQSVMLKDQIQYAVGRMDVQVQVSADAIYDNGSGVNGAYDEQEQQVTVNNIGFPLTGVLIGGQKQVDWQFTTVASADEKTIYDNVTNDTKIVRGSYNATPVTTLALETEADKDVKICLEFENNTGKDFYGYNHELVPAGSKFYLIANLDPDATAGVTQPAGATIKQVFKQDYTTVVKLTISRNSLKNAYQTIPDLRSPKLELGLSVNLEWQNGLTFEQDFQ